MPAFFRAEIFLVTSSGVSKIVYFMSNSFHGVADGSWCVPLRVIEIGPQPLCLLLLAARRPAAPRRSVKVKQGPLVMPTSQYHGNLIRALTTFSITQAGVHGGFRISHKIFGGYEGQRLDPRFFRRFRADLSIRKSSSFLPPLIAATSQRGVAPRPAQARLTDLDISAGPSFLSRFC